MYESGSKLTKNIHGATCISDAGFSDTSPGVDPGHFPDAATGFDRSTDTDGHRMHIWRQRD